MSLPVLYARSRTGRIKQWSVQVVPAAEEHAVIIKRYGQYDKKMTIDRKRIERSKNAGRKNERKPLAQAETMARSDWHRKLDEGYKSLEMLGYNGYDETITFLQRALGVSNTDAAGKEKPMLAKDGNIETVSFPCIAQPKTDGVRCLVHIHVHRDENNHYAKVAFTSRKGKPYVTLEHLTGFFLEWGASEHGRSIILDGEVYADGYSFQGMTKLVKKWRPESKLLKFRLFDVMTADTQDMRIMEIMHIHRFLNPSRIDLSISVICTNKEQLLAYCTKWESEGYEGGMVRYPGAKYEAGYRSSNLLKIKTSEDHEFIVIGAKIDKFPLDPKVRIRFATDEEIDSFTFTCRTAEGLTFDVKPTGDRLERMEDMRLFPELIGKEYTVKHWGWTDDKKPRFPVGKAFRDYE